MLALAMEFPKFGSARSSEPLRYFRKEELSRLATHFRAKKFRLPEPSWEAARRALDAMV
jgi:hypothetical protein